MALRSLHLYDLFWSTSSLWFAWLLDPVWVKFTLAMDEITYHVHCRNRAWRNCPKARINITAPSHSLLSKWKVLRGFSNNILCSLTFYHMITVRTDHRRLSLFYQRKAVLGTSALCNFLKSSIDSGIFLSIYAWSTWNLWFYHEVVTQFHTNADQSPYYYISICSDF